MRVGVFGYGNLGRSAEIALSKRRDTELFGVFSRRCVSNIKTVYEKTKVYPAAEVLKYKDDIDIMLITAGSKTDLPNITPYLARHFNLIDSYDDHEKIASHIKKTDDGAKIGGKLALVSAGWDPGFLSIARLYFSAFLPFGEGATVWGRGISQGHSEALRGITGVKDAREITVPIPEAVREAREGRFLRTNKESHVRECFIVKEPYADEEKIKEAVFSMKGYFEGYKTSVHFVNEEELGKISSDFSHAGRVFRRANGGKCGEYSFFAELFLKMESNPDFTAGILASLCPALMKMRRSGAIGAITLLDVSPKDLFPEEEYFKLIERYM